MFILSLQQNILPETGSIQYNLFLPLLGALRGLSREKHYQELA